MSENVMDSQTTIGADLDELNTEETEVEETEELEVPQESDEVEEEQEEEEEPEPEPEPQVSTHPFDRPTIKQMTEAFPDLFKKFPSLKDMYFRESEFSRVFPTIDDAKEAYENHTAFTNIRDDIFNGDGSKFISAIKEVNEKGLEKFSSNFLGDLIKVSPSSFWRAVNPFVEDIAKQMFQKGVNESNESMQNAARYLAKYFFNDVDYAEGKKTTVVKEETSEVSDDRKKFDNERQVAFRGSVSNDIKSQLVSMIEGKDSKTGKLRLDPDDVLSSFIKSTIIEHVIKDLGQQLESDKDHIRYMDSLWDRASKNGRTDAHKSSITSAYLARAKAMIPSLRSKYVSEALGRKIKDSSQRREKLESIQEERGSMGRGSNGSNKNYSPKSIDYSKTSDSDILNDRISYKN